MTQPVCTSTTTDVTAPADTITLDETARHRRRAKLTSDGGIEFLLDLPKARLLRHGEGLLLDDGCVIEVRAEPEALMEVRGSGPRHLLALAWQIGNRHLPAQIGADRILIRRDHVIEEMLKGLGATVAHVEASFDPEGGAYGDTHSGHRHDHDGHDHTHHHHHHD
ncbi:urease accessory protein UreE [Notoacmeibacter marinus]|uniref:urease accessory protein UreE n=1 Tax=Notoacmeibacter marinus TaxID=1876515 RepID=UPI000DF1B8D9|nr:urease accessory protein UreE [Notoacmeibacter marinus]